MWDVVSPHLDDAVFGCGALLAAHPGSVVVTVFTAAPADGGALTEWDARGGFAEAGAAMAARRREDESALAEVGAVPHWLDFVDGQYGDTTDAAGLVPAIADALTALGATRVFVPLGLFHGDHLRVHRAAVDAWHGLRGIPAWAYEDAIYRAMHGVLDARLAELRACGSTTVAATPTAFACSRADAAGKAGAVRRYASQAPAFGAEGMADTARPERYWRLRR